MTDVGGEPRCAATPYRIHLTAVGGVASHVKGIERDIGCFLAPANRTTLLHIAVDQVWQVLTNPPLFVADPGSRQLPAQRVTRVAIDGGFIRPS